jgi:hypothetical protein
MGGGTIQERFAVQFVDGCFNNIGANEDKGSYGSLSLDPCSNAVNISYMDFFSKDIRYAYKEDSSYVWNTMTIDSPGNGSNPDFISTSITHDLSGNRHLSYIDNSNTSLKYGFGPKILSGQSVFDISWYLFDVDPSPDNGIFSSIKVDMLGNRHISYFDISNEILKYAFGPANSDINSDITWQLYQVDNSPRTGWYNALALDSSGHPHISYFDNSNNSLKYAYGNINSTSGYDSSWQIYEIDSYINPPQYSSIVVDSSGNPHISYYDGNLKYAFGIISPNSNDIVWKIYTIESDGITGTWTSIDLNPNTQRPSILYFKFLESEKHEVKIASQQIDETWNSGVLDPSLNNVDINGQSQIKIDNDNYYHISYYDSTNLGGRLRYATNSQTTFGDYCNTFTPNNINPSVNIVTKSANPFTRIPTPFQSPPIRRLPTDPSSREVDPCPTF